MRITKPGIGQSSPDTEITYDGVPVAARRGESVASALVAAGHLTCRSTRDGDGRGVFCGMGVCSDCSVTIDGCSGRLACMEEVRPGLAVSPDPPRPQLTGALDTEVSAARPGQEVRCDLAILGAGPGGLAAATIAAEAGVDVVLLDNRRAPGGQYFKQPAETFELDEARLDRQFRSGRTLLRRVKTAGVRLLLETQVWGAAAPGHLYANSPSGPIVVRPRGLILATGAYERAVPFPGWTLPGVMTAGAAQTLLRSYLVAPGSRVLLSGNGPLNLQVAAELAAAGAEVVAVADTAHLRSPTTAAHLVGLATANLGLALRGLRYVVRLRGTPLLTRSSVVETGGNGRVEWAEVARLDRGGKPIGATRRRFDVDAVCLGYGFVPSSELARVLGCDARVDRRTGCLTINRTREGRTSVDGVWVVGDGASLGGAHVAQAAGALAGADAVRWLGIAGHPTQDVRQLRALRRHERFQRSLWQMYAGPILSDQLATTTTVVCRCEEVTLGQLTASGAPWLAAAGPLKRVSRAGMGKCQGRYCGPIVAELARRASGLGVTPRSGFAPQLPVLPTPVSTLAAPGFEPPVPGALGGQPGSAQPIGGPTLS